VRIQTDVWTRRPLAQSFTVSVVDNIAPTAPSTPDLVAASDSGSSSTDDLTHATTPTSRTAEVGALVRLYAGDTLIGRSERRRPTAPGRSRRPRSRRAPMRSRRAQN